MQEVAGKEEVMGDVKISAATAAQVRSELAAAEAAIERLKAARAASGGDSSGSGSGGGSHLSSAPPPPPEVQNRPRGAALVGQRVRLTQPDGSGRLAVATVQKYERCVSRPSPRTASPPHQHDLTLCRAPPAGVGADLCCRRCGSQGWGSSSDGQ